MENFNLKVFLQSDTYTNLRIQMTRAINNHPVNIDRSVFKKTPAEKEAVKVAKYAYRNSLN